MTSLGATVMNAKYNLYLATSSAGSNRRNRRNQLQRKIELAEVANFERIDTFLATALSFDHHIMAGATIRFIRAGIDLQQTTVRMQLRSFHLLAPAFPAT